MKSGEARIRILCRSSVAHVSLMCRSCVAHVSLMCRSCVAHVSLICRSCVAHVSILCRSYVAHVSLMCRSYVAHVSLMCRSCVAQLSDTSERHCLCELLSLTFRLLPQLALLAFPTQALPVVVSAGHLTPVVVAAARCMCAAILAVDTVVAFASSK